MNILHFLTNWFKSNCNDDWEHIYQIKIETLDNPGWHITIDLMDTDLEGKNFQQVFLHNNEKDWMICRVEKNIFHGDGDLDKLEKILEIFKNWQEENSGEVN